jgi:phenylalanyl-tRNA synthetase beta chain
MVLEKGNSRPGDVYTIDAEGVETVLEINVTTNRPDCLSVLGIAREVSVLFGVAMQPPEPAAGPTRPSEPAVHVRLVEAAACPRYSAQRISGVSIGPSPVWLRQRLESVGLHPINNVVDVTNFVMLETGQPLHAFDFNRLAGGSILVRKARSESRFTTLDGQSRELRPDDLLICDAEKPVALAGVMGGQNSEVTDATTTVLLESAYFDPRTIRQTAKRLGLSTDASQRFERGIDPNGTVRALERAAAMIVETAGGMRSSPVVDQYPTVIERRHITLRPSRVAKVLGASIETTKSADILKRLGMDVDGKDPLQVTVPTFRPDLREEIDLIEEIARIAGFDTIEPRTVSLQPMEFRPNPEQVFAETVRDILTGIGFMEAVNNSLGPQQNVSLFSPAAEPVAVRNPLSPDTAFLRTDLLPGLLGTVQWNHHRSVLDLRVFEIGRTFHARKGEALPLERTWIAGVCTESSKTKKYWKAKTPGLDFFLLKGMLLHLFERLHIQVEEFRPRPFPGFLRETSMTVAVNGAEWGRLGELDPSVLTRFDIEEAVFGFELPMDLLLQAASGTLTYQPIPRFPAVRRDLAVVVDENVPAGDTVRALRQVGGPYLQHVELFDVYRGRQIPPGKKSMAFALQFISQERTLTEEDVDPVLANVIRELERAFAASLRSQ